MKTIVNNPKRICSISLLIVLLVCQLFFKGCRKEDEMILNCDIEGPEWYHTEWPNTDFVFERSTEEYFSPTHSLKISKPTMDATKGGMWGLDFENDLPLNKTLTLSAKIKCVDLVGDGAALYIQCDSKSQASVQSVFSGDLYSIKGNTGWTEYSVSLPAIKPEVVKIMIRLRFRLNTTGTVYFDDIHLIYGK